MDPQSEHYFEWKIKNNKNYSKSFRPHRLKMPSRNGKALCGKFHIQGWFYENCMYDHNEIKCLALIYSKMSQFFQRCGRHFLNGQSKHSNTYAGPSFSKSPDTTELIPKYTTKYTLAPRPITAPQLQSDHRGPSTIQPSRANTSATMEDKLVDTSNDSSSTTQKSTNHTNYSLSLFTKAKLYTNNFLGKFLFGDNNFTAVLPSI